MVYLLLGDGFEELEAIGTCDLLRRGGIETRLLSVGAAVVTGAHGIEVTADCTMESAKPEQAEMVVLPGGMGGVASISDCPAALQLVEQVWAQGGFVAAICAAPTILAALHVTDGRKATCYPGLEDRMGSARMQKGAAAVQDGKLITGEAPGAVIPFGITLVEALRGRETAEAVKRGLQLHDWKGTPL